MASTVTLLFSNQICTRRPIVDAFIASGLGHSIVVGLMLFGSANNSERSLQSSEPTLSIPISVNLLSAASEVGRQDPRTEGKAKEAAVLGAQPLRKKETGNLRERIARTLSASGDDHAESMAIATSGADVVQPSTETRGETASNSGGDTATPTIGHGSASVQGASMGVAPPALKPPVARVATTDPDQVARLRSGIARATIYPARARRNAWQGTTRIRVASDPAHKTPILTIVTSSGYECLDQAALHAAEETVDRLHLHHPVETTIPVEFRLK